MYNWLCLHPHEATAILSFIIVVGFIIFMEVGLKIEIYKYKKWLKKHSK